MNLDTVNIYMFVAAALLSVIPVLVIFKVFLNRLKEDPYQMARVQKNFFIGVAMTKILPVILLILAIFRMPSGISMERLYVPWILIGVTMIGGFIYVSMQKGKHQNESEDARRTINTLVTITRPHLFTVPIMAIVFLYLMTV